MFQFAALAPLLKPVLFGAGVGALSSLAFGKDPVTGAVLGGATGGLLDKIPAGAWMGGKAEALSAVPSGSAGIQLAPAVADDMALSLAPQAVSTAPISYGVDITAPATTGISDLGAYATGGSGYGIMAKQPTMWDEISPYMDVKNVLGATDVMQRYSQRPQYPSPQGGSVSRGQAPEGTGVMELLRGVKMPEKKRISLI